MCLTCASLVLWVVLLPPKSFSSSVKFSATLSHIYSIFSKGFSDMTGKRKSKISEERFIMAAICWKVWAVLFFNVLQTLIWLFQDFPLFSESHRNKMSLQYKFLKSISTRLSIVCVFRYLVYIRIGNQYEKKKRSLLLPKGERCFSSLIVRTCFSLWLGDRLIFF